MANKVLNVWDKIKIYCLNHDEPIEMHIIQNTEQVKTPFYACSNYGGAGGVEPCYNRLNLDDYQGLILKFLDVIGSDDSLCTDYTNYSFEYKGTRQLIKVRVIKYSENEIHIGVLNKTVLKA